MIRVVLPHHLRTLTGVTGEVRLPLGGEATQRAMIDALEAAYPVLRGTVRDPATGRRRPFIRFFAGQEDISHADPDAALPPGVVSGADALHVVGAMAGG